MSELQRKALRTLFTKKAKSIKELIGENSELNSVLLKFSSLSEINTKLQALNDEILSKLVAEEQVTEKDIENEISNALDYTETYNEVNLLVQKLQTQNQADSISCKSTNQSCDSSKCSHSCSSSKLRLPKIELKKFDGEIKIWIGFWAQFSKIHEDEKLTVEEKFQYLIQSMAPDSSARKLIEGFPPSSQNYQKAIDLLKSRYGKDEFLIEYYVRELLALVLKREERLSVTSLYDKLEVQLRALDSLGVTKDKYAAIIFPLVESAVPEPIFKVWERHRVSRNTSTKDADGCLGELFNFLKIEVEAEERLKLRVSKFERSNDDAKQSYKTNTSTKQKTNLPSASVLTSPSKADCSKVTCVFCSKDSHASHDCHSLIDMSIAERMEVIKKKGVCLKCLKRGHLANKCKVQVKCLFCRGKHLAILCYKTQTVKPEDGNKMKESSQNTTNSFSAAENKTTYLQTLNAFIVCRNNCRKVRVLCDSGSQKSFISAKCAKELGLKPTGNVLIHQEVFGGKKIKPTHHKSYKVTLRSMDSDYSFTIDVLEQHVICNEVPQVRNHDLVKMLSDMDITLTDVTYPEEVGTTAIDLLIGADAWASIITNEFKKINDQLLAIKTRLGWTVVGTAEGESSFISSMFVSTSSSKSQDIRKFWDLETMGILEPTEKQRKEDQEAQVMKFFEESFKRDVDGRYIVKLPWIEDHPPLETNRKVAEIRLHSTTRKLQRTNLFNDYDLVLKVWLDQGIIEKVSDEDASLSHINCHYLPHRAVVKEGSSTRIRPVFDASNKDVNGYSVNGCLETGPNLIEQVPKVLTNFRLYAYALTADIEKAFLQIVVNSDDRDMLRFLWWEKEKVIVYRHARVVFGLSCSPFLLGAVLNNLLDNAPPSFQHVAGSLKKSFYVDNCLTGVNSVAEQDKFIADAQTLLRLGGFNLRGWAGNGYFKSPEHVENILGLKWLCQKDELCCKLPVSNMKPTVITRRSLLSCAQKIFDPIGFTAPVGLIPKVILQRTWALKIGWDEELPEELTVQFRRWADQIDCLEKCTMSRRMFLNESSTLHVFCDASKTAFGSCIFLRTEVDDIVHVSLVLAKSRVAPIKPISLPRLELMGAVTGVRLCTLALQCLNSSVPVFYWLDSSVALSWISKQGKWSVFVENRVKEINKFTQPTQWRHVTGTANPADLLSRGCNPEKLLNSQWWCGPKWLYEPQSQWPSERPLPDLDEIQKEEKKLVMTANAVETTSIVQILGYRFSKYSKIVRTIAWMLRMRSKMQTHKGRDINSEEFNAAEKVLLKLIQTDSFPESLKCNALSGIQKYVDEDGMIRLKSRVLNEDDCAEYQFPIILPSSHPVVEKLVAQLHLQHNHAGVQALLVILRERFWILKGRKTVRRILHGCVYCKRHSARALEVPPPPLPTDRTQISSCFQVTGVDLAGPLFAKENLKCWVVIFTCAVYRAVHLELIQSLSTDAFIQALRRFIARRGRINVIYSDNGTNFVGLSRKLKTLDWQRIQNEFNLKSIVWKFNPPAAPWWGGFWERLIKILKGLLRRNLGNACLNYEELNTLVCECEGLMNRRPLTYISEETDEMKPLTPSMFLQSICGNEVTDLDILERTSLKSRWNYIQSVRDGLNSRFKKEYLGFLKSSKTGRNDVIQVGDVVLIHTEDKKRITWPLGIVTKLFPGRDKLVRLVQVKTKNGFLLRPLQRIYPLEIKGDEENIIGKEKHNLEDSKTLSQPKKNKDRTVNNKLEVQKTRSGREVRQVKRLDL